MDRRLDTSTVFLEQSTPSTFDSMSRLHRRLRNFTHGTPIFLAWHRRFVYVMENMLREQGKNEDLGGRWLLTATHHL